MTNLYRHLPGDIGRTSPASYTSDSTRISTASSPSRILRGTARNTKHQSHTCQSELYQCTLLL